MKLYECQDCYCLTRNPIAHGTAIHEQNPKYKDVYIVECECDHDEDAPTEPSTDMNDLD